MDFTGFFIDKVMMLANIGVKDYRALPDCLHSNQALLHEKIQCVVDRGTRDRGTGLAGSDDDLIGGWMGLAGHHAFDNGDTLRSWLDLALPKDRDGVIHSLSVCLVLDNVKIKPVVSCQKDRTRGDT